MMQLVVIRPEPGCSATLAAAREVGLEAHGFPLFRIISRSWEAPPASKIDALLIGSANALRCAGDDLARYAGRPVYVVGEATASAAEAAGFTVAASGKGGLQDVVGAITHKRLLRLTGEEFVRLEIPLGITLIERIVYTSKARPMPAALAEMLVSPAVVMLHSAAAARHFDAECKRLNLDRSQLTLAVIGPRVAEAAAPGWRMIGAAPEPSDHALLALAERLCQTSAS